MACCPLKSRNRLCGRFVSFLLTYSTEAFQALVARRFSFDIFFLKTNTKSVKHSNFNYFPCEVGTCEAVRTPYTMFVLQYVSELSIDSTNPNSIGHSFYTQSFISTSIMIRCLASMQLKIIFNFRTDISTFAFMRRYSTINGPVVIEDSKCSPLPI